MTYSSVDVIWTLLGAALVYFMQAGFAMCEAGFNKEKNTGNIIMKNMILEYQLNMKNTLKQKSKHSNQ